MLENAILPTEEELAPLLEEATSNKEKSEFVALFVKNLASILDSKPIMYRAYGMYWWALKEMLVNNGISRFGESLEVGTLNVFNYEDKALLCCAAWAYHGYNVDNGLVYSSTHFAAIANDEDYTYYLEDLEMESLING
jgi:hypothetical protein